MMNSRQHWFSGGGGVAPGGGSQQGAPAPAATAAENVPANGAAAGGAAEPDAKRQRLSSAGGSARASQAQPQVERAAVAAWLASRGGASGPQLVSHFFGGTPGDGSSAARRQLLSVLAAMCDDFELVRRGTSAATSSAIDLSDPAVTFLLL